MQDTMIIDGKLIIIVPNRQYPIGFWGIQSNNDPIISAATMVDMAAIADINANIDDIDTKKHWSIPTLRS